MKRTAITLLTASLLIASATQANEKFVAFAVNHAHERGFNGCDAAIKDAFEFAGGDDLRVSSDWFKTMKGSLRITGTYGKKNDAVLVDAILTKSGGKCYAYHTTIIGYNKSCNATLAELEAFEYVAESPDYIWTENAGGVDMLLTPVGNGCNATFRRSAVY